MTITNKTMELLAPAGSEEAFNAAMHNGADAIYLGAGPHHARQLSGGFSEASFFSLVEKARMAGIKAYLTLNTLLMESELEAAVSWAEKAWQGGVDAIIVQDIGLAHRLHLQHPEMVLHASTQMSIHNTEGVLAAREAGFSRAVLARELSLAAIAAIHAQSDLALEVFAHGALCVCYSGQCLMSSLIGGRSGNRGLCAQPCRLPWKLSGSLSEGYLLSMKDLMALQLLPKLHMAGVTSLKIEGRMKSPEYVAIVTGIYRKYLDLLAQDGPERYAVDPQDEKALLQIFNRGGFTRKYLIGKQSESLHRYTHAASGSTLRNVNGASPSLHSNQHTDTGRSTAEFLVDTTHPKHLGISIGTVLSWKVPYAEVSLTEDLTQGDGLEIHKGGKGGNSVVSTMLTAILSKGKHEKQAFSGSTILLGDVKEPVSAGDIVYRTSQKSQLQSAMETVNHWQVHRVPLRMGFSMQVGSKATLTIEDEKDHHVSVQSENGVEAARERALGPERIREQLEKTGDAPWNLLSADIRTDGRGTMPVREINAMRRSALDHLAELRISDITRQGVEAITLRGALTENPSREKLSCGPERLSLAFSTQPDSEWLRQSGLAAWADKMNLMIPLVSPEALTILKKEFPGSIWICTPSILSDERMDRLLRQLESIRADMSGLSAGNPGMLRRLRIWAPELPILADTGMNLWNGEAIRQAAAWGADMVLLSPELTAAALGEIKGSVLPVASWAYGRVPVMTMEHCPGSLDSPQNGPLNVHCDSPLNSPPNIPLNSLPNGSCGGCCGTCHRKTGILTDRAGARFPYVRDVFSGKTVLFHHRPLRWRENEWHPQAARLYALITDESPAAASALVKSLLSGHLDGE